MRCTWRVAAQMTDYNVLHLEFLYLHAYGSCVGFRYIPHVGIIRNKMISDNQRKNAKLSHVFTKLIVINTTIDI